MIRFVKAIGSDQCAERNAAGLQFGLKIAGTSNHKHKDNMGVDLLGEEDDEGEDKSWQSQINALQEMIMALSKGKRKGKGKDNDYWGGKGKDYWSGQWQPGGWQGKGGGNNCNKGGKNSLELVATGTGKGEGKFQGECNFCGVYGHRMSECRKLDAAMMEKGKGTGKGRRNLQMVEDEKEEHEEEEVEQPEGEDEDWEWGTKCLTRAPPKPTLKQWVPVKTTNRFQSLQPIEEEEKPPNEASSGSSDDLVRQEWLNSLGPSWSQSFEEQKPLGEWRTAVSKNTKKQAAIKRRQNGEEQRKNIGVVRSLITKTKRSELRERLLDTIREKAVGRTKRILIIVDSGACDHVMPKQMLLHTPINKGTACKGEVMYVSADGGRIPNLGEAKVSMRVGNQRMCTLFQVADITQPVLSVTKLTEDGHRVNFSRKGGTITSSKSGKTVHFRRYKGVYVLEAEMDTGRREAGCEAQGCDGAPSSSVTTAGQTSNQCKGRRAPASSSATAHKKGGIEATEASTFRRQGR